MTKKEAMESIKNMNLPVPVVEALIAIIVNLDYDSYMAGYCQGYDDSAARTICEYY